MVSIAARETDLRFDIDCVRDNNFMAEGNYGSKTYKISVAYLIVDGGGREVCGRGDGGGGGAEHLGGRGEGPCGRARRVEHVNVRLLYICDRTHNA